MPADSRQVTDARMAIKAMLKDFDIFLSSGRSGSVSSLEQAVKRLRDLFLLLNFDTLEHLPKEWVAHIKNHATEAHRHFSFAVEITDQGVGTISHGQDREIDNVYDRSFNVFVSAACYQVSSLGLDGFKTHAQQTVEQINTLNKETQKTAEEAKQKFDSVFKDAVEMAQQQAVSEQMAAFQEEANDGKDAAENWLWACGISVVGFFLVALWSALDLPNMDSTGEVVFYAVTRLAAFSVFVYALFFCAKNYAAHRHNYVVNKHRFNALRTYRAFIEASPTPETRNIVLMQAARCIYEQRDSGYTKSGGNDGNTVNLSPVETIQKVAKAADDN